MENKKLTTENYKGTRDFYPEDMAIRKYLFGVMRKAVEKYGYVEYDASIIEETDLYRAKSGEEIINEQTYTFQDRGGRDVTIRPEMTPTVARMIAKKRKELTFPLRWYSIPNLMRYERPQRGRLREHWQLNVDMFGVDEISADSETIAVAYAIMCGYGAKEKDFQILVNDRGLNDYILKEYIGASEDVAYKLSKLIDRKKKMSEEEFIKRTNELLGEENAEKFKNFLATTSLEELPKEIRSVESAVQLREVIEQLKTYNIGNVIYDPTVMRGFDYYTGTVFEIFDTHPDNNRALFGGGRYDDLVGMFGVEKVTGVGFGMGDVTIRDFLETHGLMPDITSTTDVYLCVLDKQYVQEAVSLAEYLRKENVTVFVDCSGRKAAKQLKAADQRKVRYAICIGENEIETNIYKLKRLTAGTEKELKKEDLMKEINCVARKVKWSKNIKNAVCRFFCP